MHLKKTFFLEVIMAVELEKYHGIKSRHTCPQCGVKKCFVRYIDEAGRYVANHVGRCNRESKCGYHLKPKDFYAANPQPVKRYLKPGIPQQGFINKNGSQSVSDTRILSKTPDFIPNHQLLQSLGNYERNAFVQFLLNLFPDCSDAVQAVLKMYFVGTYEDYTCFPSIDRLNRVCRAKLIRFNPATGKRRISGFLRGGRCIAFEEI